MILSSGVLEIIGPALVAGLMISLTHAPLGIEVLRRNIIFIDLAVAQIAGLGLIAASLFLVNPSHWVIQLAGLGSAIVAGVLFRKVEKSLPIQQEAIIGCCFILAASLSLLLLADHPHGGEQIKELLSGQMLFVTWIDILKHAPIYVFIVTVWFVRPSVRINFGFYLMFALAITSSVQLVGVYVVFASLILPALAAFHSDRPYIAAWLCGAISVFAGIGVSLAFDLPSGPVTVLCYSVTAITMRTLPHRIRKNLISI